MSVSLYEAMRCVPRDAVTAIIALLCDCYSHVKSYSHRLFTWQMKAELISYSWSVFE